MMMIVGVNSIVGMDRVLLLGDSGLFGLRLRFCLLCFLFLFTALHVRNIWDLVYTLLIRSACLVMAKLSVIETLLSLMFLKLKGL